MRSLLAFPVFDLEYWEFGYLMETNQISNFCWLAVHQEQVRPSPTGFVTRSRRWSWMGDKGCWCPRGDLCWVCPPLSRALSLLCTVLQVSAVAPAHLRAHPSRVTGALQGRHGRAVVGWFPCRRAGFEEETQSSTVFAVWLHQLESAGN